MQLVAVVMGWFLVITGSLMAFNPEWARRKMLQQGYKIALWYLFLAFLFAGSLVVSWAARAKTAAGWFAAAAAVFFLIWVFIVFIKKISGGIKAFTDKATVVLLRYYAAAQIAVGVVMLLLRKRFLICAAILLCSFQCFASDGNLAPVPEAPVQLSLKGALVDNLSAAEQSPEQLVEFVKSYNKTCALTPQCAVSGYSIVSGNKRYVFDRDSCYEIEAFLKQPKTTLNVEIEATLANDELSLDSIKSQ